VNFEYASAKLSPDARIVLDNLGQALNHASLQNARIQLVGHTDAKGGDAYNLTLSRQRAQSVANYLSGQHGIAAKRLTVEGMGRSQLAVADEPYSALNRRVQVINLGQP
jgi:outer membrane protein OmpA-like peptidoglycan-associated protein